MVEMDWKDDMLDDGSGGAVSSSCCCGCSRLKKLRNWLSQDDTDDGADMVERSVQVKFTYVFAVQSQSYTWEVKSKWGPREGDQQRCGVHHQLNTRGRVP